MKRSSSSLKKGGGGVENGGNQRNDVAIIDWELRPGGMLVQKRGVGSDGGVGGASSGGPMIKIKVSHGSSHHDITVPAQSTFGDLKRVLARETGLKPKEQRLLFKGKEKDDGDYLHMVGVTDMSKVILLEDPASKERKLQQVKRNAYENMAKVHSEVDKLSDKVVGLETAVKNGSKVANKEFVLFTELLMVQLLQLDSIEADGDAKLQRRAEVRRVQSLVDTLDKLKATNSNSLGSSTSSVLVNTKWETFDSGVGSLSPPNPSQFSTKITKNWEIFG